MSAAGPSGRPHRISRLLKNRSNHHVDYVPILGVRTGRLFQHNLTSCPGNVTDMAPLLLGNKKPWIRLRDRGLKGGVRLRRRHHVTRSPTQRLDVSNGEGVHHRKMIAGQAKEAGGQQRRHVHGFDVDVLAPGAVPV